MTTLYISFRKNMTIIVRWSVVEISQGLEEITVILRGWLIGLIILRECTSSFQLTLQFYGQAKLVATGHLN